MDSLSREKEARLAAERLQTSLKEDLEKAQQEQQSSNQKVGSTNLANQIYKDFISNCSPFVLQSADFFSE